MLNNHKLQIHLQLEDNHFGS